MTLTAASPINIGSSHFVRPVRCLRKDLKSVARCRKTARIGWRRASTKSPISVPVSPSSALECYPCREVTLNYNRSLLFHGGDTGSIPVRDAKLDFPPEIPCKYLKATPTLQLMHYQSDFIF